MGPMESGGTGPSRRQVLCTVGSITVALGLAGCSNVTEYEFTADRVVLPVDARTRLGLPRERDSSVVTEASRTVGDTEVTATIESKLSVYAAPGSEGEAPLSPVAALSTPAAEVRGTTLNPFVRQSVEGLVTSSGAAGFRQAAGVTEDDDVEWERDPEVVARRDATCLGDSVTVESHAGVLDADAEPLTVLHLVRAEAASIVLVAAAQRRPVGASPTTFVGTDGAISQDAFDAAVESFVGVVESLTYESG